MNLVQRFREIYHQPPTLVVWSPGRVNLIGEHTDYNDGFVLPAAIARGVSLAVAPRADRIVRVHALNLSDGITFSLDALARDDAHSWSNYIRGVANEIQARGELLRGMDSVLWGDLPIGASLSSSAAVEVATAFAFKTLSALDLPLEQIPQLCQRAENVFVGVQCGIMDQFAVTFGKRDHALLLDCRSLEYRHVPIPSPLRLVVCDTRKPHTLATSAYNERRRESEQGARLLGIQSLRDVTVNEFNARQNELPEPIRRRVRHVVTENQRVLDLVTALARNDLASVRALMLASHASLRDDYQVSVRELDVMVELAQAQAGCYGARMTGAGFGGATVNLVAQDAVAEFGARVAEGYQNATGVEPLLLVTRAQDGVHSVSEVELN